MCTREKVSCTARETIRNIVFVPGKAEISAFPSEGLTKDNSEQCDCCHLRVRPLDGNRGRVTIKGPLPSKGLHNDQRGIVFITVKLGELFSLYIRILTWCWEFNLRFQF